MKNAKLEVVTELPVHDATRAGQIVYYDNKAYYCNGTTWVEVTENADTHNVTRLYAGTGVAENNASQNGNSKLVVTDDNVVRNAIIFKG